MHARTPWIQIYAHNGSYFKLSSVSDQKTNTENMRKILEELRFFPSNSEIG